GVVNDPILRPLEGFQCIDAVLDLSDPANPREPDWPEADFVVGNPPFLGGKKMRAELGDKYVAALFKVWRGRCEHRGGPSWGAEAGGATRAVGSRAGHPACQSSGEGAKTGPVDLEPEVPYSRETPSANLGW